MRMLTGPLCFLLMVSFAGCGDKTLDDYQKDKLDKDLTEIQNVTGKYSGVLLSSSDGSILGSIQVTLEPESEVSQTLHDLVSEKAKIRVKVQYYGRFQSLVQSSKTSYISAEKRVKANLPIGTTDGLVLNAALENDILKGALSAEGYDEEGGQFELKKDAPLPEAQGLSARANRDSLVQKFSGAKPSQGVSQPGTQTATQVKLSIELDKRTTEEQLYLLLVPVKTAQVTFEFFFKPCEMSEPCKVSLVFLGAQYDERNGAILGETTIQRGDSYRYSLDCRKKSDSSSWQCRINSSAQGEILNTLFTGVDS